MSYTPAVNHLFKKGTFTTSGTSVTEFRVVCGFRPRYVAIYFNGASGTMTSAAVGAVRCIYDEDYSSGYVHRAYRSSANAVNTTTADRSGDTRICEFTDDGFIWRNGAAAQWNGEHHYIAVR